MKRTLVLGIAALVCLVANQASADPHLNFGKNLNAAQCSPSATSKMVLNVVYQVTNDADSGVGGFWALDSYMKHVQVWDQGDSSFCVIAKYNGSFVSVAGPSPNNTGFISAGVTGTMEGGYSATLTGVTFAPGTKRTKGNIGTKDYLCQIGTTNNATGCQYYNLFIEYFSGYSASDFAYAGAFQWGWIYRAGDNGTWVNANSGSTGDIIGQ